MIDTVLSLPVDFTTDERARLNDIRRDIQRLPEVLAPWIGTPMGTRQYIEQMSSPSTIHTSLFPAITSCPGEWPD